jgi:hypothetical protein
MASLCESASYSETEIDAFTKSAECFEKAAQIEAVRVWEGIVDELRKEGADDAFIDGMTKEAVNLKGLANLGNLGMQLFRGGNYKALGDVAKGVFRNARSAPAAEKAIAKGQQFGAFVDDAGKVLHGEGLDKLKGARSYGLAEDLMASNPDLYKQNSKAFSALKKMKSDAASQLTEGFAKENQGILDRTYLDTLHAAEFGTGSAKTDAAQALKDIGAGKFDPLAARSGVGKGVASRVTNIHSTTPGKTHPADQGLVDHLEKMKGHAADIGHTGVENAPSWADQAAPHVATGTRSTGKGMFRFAPWEGVKGAFTGGMLGSLASPILGPLGPLAGAGALGAYKAFGPAGALAATGLGLYGGKKALNGLGVGGASPAQDASGLQADRHRVVPFMSNQATGAVGGALLAMLISREMGLEGAGGLIAPILGGIAGYNYLPQMMNKWKDPYGSGANSMNPFAAAYNRQNPFVGAPETPQSYSASLPPPQQPQP